MADEKKMTYKSAAKKVGLSERAFRLIRKKGRYLDIIEEKLEGYRPELYEVLNKHVCNESRKKGITLQELELISELPPEKIKDIIESLYWNPETAKRSLSYFLPQHDISSQVILPAEINTWYIMQAKENNVTKQQFMSFVLWDYYQTHKK